MSEWKEIERIKPEHVETRNMKIAFLVTAENQPYQALVTDRIRQLGGAKNGHDVVLFSPRGFVPLEKVRNNLAACFDNFTEVTLGLRYQGVAQDNLMFWEMASHMAHFKTSIWMYFQRCVPLKPGWADTLFTEFSRVRPTRIGALSPTYVTDPVHGERVQKGHWLPPGALFRPTLLQESPLLKNLHKYVAAAPDNVLPWWKYARPELIRGAHKSDYMQYGPAKNWTGETFEVQGNDGVEVRQVNPDAVVFVGADTSIFGEEKAKVVIKSNKHAETHFSAWHEMRRKARDMDIPGYQKMKRPELEAAMAAREAKQEGA